MTDTQACPHCFSEIDARATVCPKCRRDIVPLPAAPQAKAARRPVWQYVLIALIAAAVIFYGLRQIAARSILDALEEPQRQSVPTFGAVIYEVVGKPPNTGVSLTYENDTGNTEQHDVALPWQKTLYLQSGQFVYVSAQLEQASGFEITCRIIAGNRVIETATSSGQYSIATCSGRTP